MVVPFAPIFSSSQLHIIGKFGSRNPATITAFAAKAERGRSNEDYPFVKRVGDDARCLRVVRATYRARSRITFSASEPIEVLTWMVSTGGSPLSLRQRDMDEIRSEHGE